MYIAKNRWGAHSGLVLSMMCMLPFRTDNQSLANACCLANNNWMINFRNDRRYRLEVGYEMFRERTGLKQLSREYNCFDGYILSEAFERDIGALLELVSSDQMLKESDYPNMDWLAKVDQNSMHWIGLERNDKGLFG